MHTRQSPLSGATAGMRNRYTQAKRKKIVLRWSKKSGHKNNVNLCSNERQKNKINQGQTTSSLRC